MAKENVELFQAEGVTKIITQCPHCFTTLKNDYRQYGLELEVIHHSELLAELLAERQAEADRRLTELGNIVFHDSCYLGRHNDIYEPPREVIAAATGAVTAGVGTNHGSNAFCCGAGGGRMWMEEHTGEPDQPRPGQEALAAEPDTICVACPYCMTMFEDGLKDEGAGDKVRVKDIAEVVAEAFRPH